MTIGAKFAIIGRMETLYIPTASELEQMFNQPMPAAPEQMAQPVTPLEDNPLWNYDIVAGAQSILEQAPVAEPQVTPFSLEESDRVAADFFNNVLMNSLRNPELFAALAGLATKREAVRQYVGGLSLVQQEDAERQRRLAAATREG